ncbi:MAG: hypothetical protein ACKV1O_30610 [Saprospiraceae bacterium]
MATIIALIIALGLIGNPEEFNTLTHETQQHYISIVTGEDIHF